MKESDVAVTLEQGEALGAIDFKAESHFLRGRIEGDSAQSAGI